MSGAEPDAVETARPAPAQDRPQIDTSPPNDRAKSSLCQERLTRGKLMPVGTLIDRDHFLGELLVEAYTRGREDQRRRMREIAASSPTLRALYRALMREAAA